MFLYNGRYPTLAHRLTGHLLSQAEPNQARQLNFEYLNQQLIWGELQQFVMFLLPLVTPGSAVANPALTGLLDPIVKLMAGDHPSEHKYSMMSKAHCTVDFLVSCIPEACLVQAPKLWSSSVPETAWTNAAYVAQNTSLLR